MGDIETKEEDIDEKNCDKMNQNVDQKFDEPMVNCAEHYNDNVELTPEQETLVENIKQTYNQILIESKCVLKNIKYIPNNVIKEKADKIYKTINSIPTKTLRETNILILAGAKIITDELGVPKKISNVDKDPP